MAKHLHFHHYLIKALKFPDYAEWINRNDMALPDDFVDFHASIIAQNSQAVTAIIWVKSRSPWETHTNEIENFFDNRRRLYNNN